LSEIDLAIDLAIVVGLPILAFSLYAGFIYWFASKHKKIDIYVQPQIFKWQVKTILLIIGTVVTLFLLQPNILFGALFGQTIGSIEHLSSFVELLYLSIMLLGVLIGLAIWPAIFFLIMAALLPMFTVLAFSTNTMANMVFYGYICLGMIPIYLSLFASSRQAVDTLILRIKEAGNFGLSSQMEEKNRIGIGGFIVGAILPLALPVRWIRRGTKVGALKITLSISQHSERYTTVTLEKMSNSPEEAQTRISKIADQITGEDTNF